MGGVVRADGDGPDPGQVVGGPERHLEAGQATDGVAEEETRIDRAPYRVAGAAAKRAHAPEHVRIQVPPGGERFRGSQGVRTDQQAGADHQGGRFRCRVVDQLDERARVPGRDAPGSAEPFGRRVGQGGTRSRQDAPGALEGVPEGVFRVVQEDEVRRPSEVAVRLFDGCSQPGRIKGVLGLLRSGEVADLGGDRQARQ